MRSPPAVATGALLVAGCAVLVGCGTSDNPRWMIGMSQCNLGEPWRVQMNADVKAAAERHNEETRAGLANLKDEQGRPYTQDIEVIFKDAQNDTQQQRAHVEEFVSQGVDLIIVSPKEAEPLTDPVARAVEAGIPVIVLDRDLSQSVYTCFVGADNVQIGEAAGRWLVEALNKKGIAEPKVVELKGLMTSTPGQDRHTGFRRGIEGSDVEIIFEADMKWLEPDATKEMESALSRFDTIHAVYAHNDPGAHGAYLAADRAERAKDVIFVGIDALPKEGQMYVREGILDATFLYPTGGAEAIDVALKILAGQDVPKKIVLDSRIFTADNVERGGEALKMEEAPEEPGGSRAPVGPQQTKDNPAQKPAGSL